jgi:hypothetical protein
MEMVDRRFVVDGHVAAIERMTGILLRVGVVETAAPVVVHFRHHGTLLPMMTRRWFRNGDRLALSWFAAIDAFGTM